MASAVAPSVVLPPLPRAAGACDAAVTRSRLDRGATINRILDWCDEARAGGRAERAQFLTCLAWEAYDRLPA